MSSLGDRARLFQGRAAYLALLLLTLTQGAFLASSGAAGAETLPHTSAEVHLSLAPDQARGLARRALDLGNPELAVLIAQQILAQDPKDGWTSLILAAAHAKLGQSEAAARAGQQAYRLSPDRDIRLQAAFLTAAALARLDRPAAAKLWLRRADMSGPSPVERSELRRAYAYLDQRTPLKFSAELNIRPSNNVNGGSLHDSFDIWGLKIPISQALPGATVDAGLRFSYQLSASEEAEWLGFARISRHEVILSQRAKKLQPQTKGWQLASSGIDIGVAGYMQATPLVGLRFSGQIGRRWFGGGGRREVQRLDFGIKRALAGDRILEARLSAEASQYPSQPKANAVQWDGDLSLTQPLRSGSFTVTLGKVSVVSKAPGIAYEGLSMGLDWTPPRLANGMSLDFFAKVERRDYWRSGFEPDLQILAGVSAEFGDVSWMGFSPTVTLSANRTRSEVVVRDTFDMGLSVGLNSRF